MAREPQHGRKPARRFDLTAIGEIGREAHRIAALVAGRKIGPAAGREVDLPGRWSRRFG